MTQPKIKILSKKEKEQILQQLNQQFGIKEIPGDLISRGKERIILFTGNLNEEQIQEIGNFAQVEGIGNYFAKIDERSKGIRLSIESTQLFGSLGQITKNIFELETDEQLEKWMSGSELNIETRTKGFIIIKYKNDFLGCGKASQEKIGNFIPKNRRLVLK